MGISPTYTMLLGTLVLITKCMEANESLNPATCLTDRNTGMVKHPQLNYHG